jgi:anti-sigma regulatory factor (Ser/Thr protein kinase)
MSECPQRADELVQLIERLQVDLPFDSASSRTARRETISMLGSRCADAVLDDVLMVVTELVNNAIDHTGAACTLTIELRPGTILVEVRDADGRPPNRPHRDDEFGRGLGVVQSLTDRWGIDRVADGKCVWAEITLPGS